METLSPSQDKFGGTVDGNEFRPEKVQRNISNNIWKESSQDPKMDTTLLMEGRKHNRTTTDDIPCDSNDSNSSRNSNDSNDSNNSNDSNRKIKEQSRDETRNCSNPNSHDTGTTNPPKNFQLIVTLSSYLDRTYRYWNKHNRWFYLSFAMVAFYVIVTRARPLPHHHQYRNHHHHHPTRRSFHLRLWPRIRNLTNSILYPTYYQQCLKEQEKKEPPPHPTFLINTSYEEGLQKWRETLEWRMENNVDAILSNPPPKYDLLKSVFLPTSLYNHDKKGNVVLIEQWGEVNTRAIKQHKISHQEMIDLFVFETEWLWTIGQQKPTDKLTLIMDIKNIPMDRFLSFDALRLVKERIQIGCNHYPNRGANIILVNVPPFFNAVYQMAIPLLSDETKERVVLMTSEDVLVKHKMLEYIEKRYLLPEYGGSCKTPFGQSSMDMRLKKHVVKHGTR